MQPIFFEPVYKNVIWGGTNIAKVFKRDIKGEDVGESWELSAHKNGLSIIKNGEFAGISLLELFNRQEIRKEIFGEHCAELTRFPVLIKFIDANKNLSIQVHPDNEYAFKNENDSGKNEVWYVMDCKEGTNLVYGFKDNVTSENLEEAIEKIEDNVNYEKIHKGDFISIPAGTIHAIMEGTLICEVQQSSDVTYRVYDWNRVGSDGKPRELHKEKSLDVIDLASKREICNYKDIDKSTNMYKSDIFSVDMIKVEEKIETRATKESFIAYIVIEGERSFTIR